MQAIEAYHPDHSPEAVARYRHIAGREGLLVTGGSDYHGEDDHGDGPRRERDPTALGAPHIDHRTRDGGGPVKGSGEDLPSLG